MSRFLRTSACLLCGLALLSACHNNTVDPTDQRIDPSNANALSRVLVMPDGTQMLTGAPPASSALSAAPVLTSLQTQVTASNGSTTPLSFSYGNVDDNLGGYYVQVIGADAYFRVPHSGQSSSIGWIYLPIGLPGNVDEGFFSVNVSVYDAQGRVSNAERVYVSVLRLGSGALQISLSWNTPTDQDLYVTDPQGSTIWYGETNASSGGLLDRDETDGFGPENIFWLESAPDGTYSVTVNDFTGTRTPNTCYVTVTAPGISRAFTATTQYGSTARVVTFTKAENRYTFHQ